MNKAHAEAILTKIANENSYESWSEFMNDSHEHTQIEYTIAAMEEYASKGMRWVLATPKDFDSGLKHKFFRDTKTKENLSAGAAFSFFKRNCIDLVEILSESPDKENEPVSDQLSIDELLSEFKRQGFDTSNWDGDEGAEKAIVDGVVNSIHDKADRLEAENEILKMENSHSKLVVDEAKREIDRLKWLINRTWTDDLVLEFVSNVVLGRTDGKLLGEYMKKFKANNNL